MTGYGEENSLLTFWNNKEQQETISCNISIRGVNRKHLEVVTHTPCPEWESFFNQRLRQEICRGQIHLSVQMHTLPQENPSENNGPLVNEARILKLFCYCQSVEALLPNPPKEFSYSLLQQMLSHPDTPIQGANPPLNTPFESLLLYKNPLLTAEVYRTFELALAKFLSSCTEEGHRLQDKLIKYVTQLESYHQKILCLLPELQKEREERLSLISFHEVQHTLNRINLMEPSPFFESELPKLREDLKKYLEEVIISNFRHDIEEELLRIEIHLKKLRTILTTTSSEPIGKKSEFYVQELLREANTLGAKIPHLHQLSDFLIEMKTTLDRFREQIQNIE
jgi:uncharacterized protein YicC (UPF0701 family)